MWARSFDYVNFFAFFKKYILCGSLSREIVILIVVILQLPDSMGCLSDNPVFRVGAYLRVA